MRSTLKQVTTMYYLWRAMRPANAEHVRSRMTMKITGVAINQREKGTLPGEEIREFIMPAKL